MSQLPFEESERRQPGPPQLSFEELLAAFERSRDEHLLAGPATETELQQLEQILGARLPAQFRRFLAQLGGGLFFRGHEIFGPRRAMVHDIELVPDVLSVRRALAARGEPLPAAAVPFHRARGQVHFLALGGPQAGRVVGPAGAPVAPGLSSFLEAVVMPRVTRDLRGRSA